MTFLSSNPSQIIDPKLQHLGLGFVIIVSLVAQTVKRLPAMWEA